MDIPKEAKECWFHSCAAHYCTRESWTENCTYPNCKVKDWNGNPYYIHKKPQYNLPYEYEEKLLEEI